MNIKKIGIWGLVAAVLVAALRSFQFLVLFDSDTGFFRDDGILSAAALVIAFTVPIAAFFAALIKKTNYGRVKFSRHIPMGVGSLLCAALVTWGLKLLHDETVTMGRAVTDTAMGISFEKPFIWFTLCLLLFLLVSAVAWLSGKALFRQAKPVYLLAVVWALSLILYAFIHYSISVLITENIFIIILSCASAVAFMAQARFFSDINPQGKSLRVLVPSTVLSAVLMTGYAVSGLVIRFAHIHPKYEVSLPLDMIILGVGIYMFLVVFSLRFVPLAVPSKPKNSEGKRYKVDIKREL